MTDNCNYELNKELRGLKNDQLMTERAVMTKQEEIAKKLHGEMGQDMIDVLNGRKKVKLSINEKIKYRVNRFFNKLFEIL